MVSGDQPAAACLYRPGLAAADPYGMNRRGHSGLSRDRLSGLAAVIQLLSPPGQRQERPGTAPPTATFINRRPGSRCAMGTFAAIRAEARLLDSFHAVRPPRSKITHDLEPRYGIEP